MDLTPKNISEAKLRQLYTLHKLSIPSIAKLLNCGRTTVLKYMDKYKISRRSIAESLKGKPKSIEHRQKMSECKKGAKHPNFGKKRPSSGKRCWYTCPNGKTVSMRSQWEVWYAEYLTEKGLAWEYESKTFVLADGSAYTPDFLVLDTNTFIEVKGWLTPEHQKRIEKFRDQYPDVKFVLANKLYLEELGIDLRRKWIKSKPQFPCEHCETMYYRSCPTQRFCGVTCRNIHISQTRTKQ